MKYASMCGAVLLAVAAMMPNEVLAKGPSGGSGSGSKGYGGGSSGSKSWSGKNWNWNKNWQGHSDWYPYHRYRYDNYYPYGYYTEPLYEEPVYSGLPIKIVNPAGSGVTLTYRLNGERYTIPPGYSQKLIEDRDWVIEFSRGQGFGPAEYSLEPGVFTFGYSNHGWDLFRGSPATAGPTNPAPPEATPVNPPPKTARVPEVR
ncbi:MAG: hypothetical protein LLG00_11455 [Planctomycetaceae bacterium]|nr:hypothetical protein [Planctomycetaceae bacterium]